MSRERELLSELLEWHKDKLATNTDINFIMDEVEDFLAKPEVEPVAYILKGQTMTGDIADYLSWTKLGMGVVNKIDGYEPEPLYTHPPRQPVQLSDEEIRDLIKLEYHGSSHRPVTIDFARALISTYEEKQKMTDALWSTQSIAEYSRLSVRHVRNVLVRNPTFPKPSGKGRARRWHPVEVKQWFNKQR